MVGSGVEVVWACAVGVGVGGGVGWLGGSGGVGKSWWCIGDARLLDGRVEVGGSGSGSVGEGGAGAKVVVVGGMVGGGVGMRALLWLAISWWLSTGCVTVEVATKSYIMSC